MKYRGTRMAKVQDRGHRFIYKLSGGRIGSRITDDEGDSPILLLTTTGRRSGKPRTHPLLYIEADDGYVVVASNAGADEHPAWFLNIEAEPEATVQIGKVRERVIAHVASAEEREKLWPKLIEMYSGYDVYQADTERALPVVVLNHVVQAPNDSRTVT